MYYWSEVLNEGERSEKILGRSNDLQAALKIARYLSEKNSIEILVLDDVTHQVTKRFLGGEPAEPVR